MSISMNSKERVVRTFNRQETDRMPILDCLWSTTVERWKREGLPEDVRPEDYFCYDIAMLSPDLSLMLPIEVLEDNDEYTIIKNSYGTIVKNFKHSTSTPAWLGHTVNSPDDWFKFKNRFKWENSRINPDAFKRQYEKAKRDNKFVVYTGAISWDSILQMVGPEALLLGFYDEPEWIHEMFEAALELYISGYESLCKLGYEFDGGWVYNDMAYKNSLLFSPQIYKEFFFERDRRVCSIFRNQGKPVILHSCGCIKEIIPLLIQAGYSCLQLLEVKAGMDLLRLQEEFSRDICFMGGIDASLLATNDKQHIEGMLKHIIGQAVRNGGYFYHSDHSVPDTVSLETYKFVLDKVKEYSTLQ